MRINELNTFSGSPGSSDYLAIDNSSDTAKISAPNVMEYMPLNTAAAAGTRDGDLYAAITTLGWQSDVIV